MSEEINHGRRRFLGTAAMTFAAAQLGLFGYAKAEADNTKPDLPAIKPGTNTSFGPHCSSSPSTLVEPSPSAQTKMVPSVER